VAYSSAPVAIDRRRGAVVVFRDISERNRAEAERLRADGIHASRARIVQAALDERRRLGRVAAVGGTLTIESPPGAGTRLTAELPVASAVTEPEER
jgi:hypothetical protein